MSNFMSLFVRFALIFFYFGIIYSFFAPSFSGYIAALIIQSTYFIIGFLWIYALPNMINKSF